MSTKAERIDSAMQSRGHRSASAKEARHWARGKGVVAPALEAELRLSPRVPVYLGGSARSGTHGSLVLTD